MSFPEQAVRSLVITTGMKNAGKGNAAGYFPHGSAFPLPSTPHQNMTDEKMSTEGTNEIQDPRGEFRQEGYEQQQQKAPGLQSEMKPVPDSGEQSYHGCNRLRGRKALVTGGDSGIGRAAAIAYAREGADVALNYLPEEQSDAEEVAELIRKEGRKAVLLPGDLSDEAFCKKLVRDALEKLGGLDIMALAAGKQVAMEDIRDITTEQLTKTFEVNVFSLFWIAREALPHLGCPQRHPGQRGGSRPHLDSPASNRRPAAEGPAGIRTENASQKGRATCGAFRTVRLSRLPGIQLHYCGGLWRYRRHASGLMRKPAIREKGRTDFPESLSAAPHPRMTGKAAGNGSARKSGHCSISRLSRQKVPA